MHQLLESFDCVQHVQDATHTAGHTLDLVITRRGENLSDLSVGELVSDHYLITFRLDINRPHLNSEVLSCRPWKKLSFATFEADLVTTRLISLPEQSTDLTADELANLYNDEMSQLLDRHCPVVKRQAKRGLMTPWFDFECRTSRRHTRMYERRYRRSQTDADRLAWFQQIKIMGLLYEEKSHLYWQMMISHNKDNAKKLWRTFDSILRTSKQRSTSVCSTLSADEFAKFFQQKVEKVRAATASVPPPQLTGTVAHLLDSWTPVQPEEIVKLISQAANKSCQLDPVPTWIVKKYSSLLAPFLATLFNKSLESGVYPTIFKHAIVLPLLKKDNLDVTQPCNYRPVSNLPFISKLLEKIVLVRLQRHLDRIVGVPRHQSAYRKGHSTETATLKVLNDMLMAADRGEVTVLCLLDLSAAFDTVDHKLLISRLQCRVGVVDIALEWITSYLTGRSYSVVYGSFMSDAIQLECSVPQGSVLGPVLFLLYTAELSDLATDLGRGVAKGGLRVQPPPKFWRIFLG